MPLHIAPHLVHEQSNSSISTKTMLFQRRFVPSVIPFILAVISLSCTVHEASTVKSQSPSTTGITDTDQYLATAAATNKLGECLPTSTDDTSFTCFAKLRAIATGTGKQNRTRNTTGDTGKNSATLKYVHHDDCFDDEIDACPDWAASGECNINPDYMLVHCRYSCQTCYDIVDGHGGIVQVAPGSPELRHTIARYITDTAHYIRTIRQQYPQVRSTCRNHHAECTYKAVQGQCLLGSDTASFMHQHCPAACRTCV